MAIGVPLTIGQNAEAFTASTITLTTSTTVPPGAKVICFVGWGFSTATLSSASDNATLPLTWRVDRQVANGNIHMGLIEADAPQGLPSGTVITATFSAATPDARQMSGCYVRGIAPGASFNGTTDTTGTTVWTSASLTPPTGRLMIGGCYGGNTASPTSTPGGAAMFELHDFANAGFSAMVTEWRTTPGVATNIGGTWSVSAGGNASLASVFLAAPDGFAPARPLLVKMNPIGWGKRFLRFPLPDLDFPVVAGDVTVVVGAATGLGVTVAPTVTATVAPPASLANGSSPAPVVNVVRPVTAGLALGVTPAPTPLVVVFPTAALALGVTPAPTVVIGAADVTVTPAAAIALGVTPAPLVKVDTLAPKSLNEAATALGVAPSPAVLVTAVSTAALALGVTPAPAKLVVVFPTAALALGVTPAPAVVIGGAGVTVTPSAALALGVTPQPTVLVVVPLSASVGLGVTPPAQPGKSVVVSASVALGVAPAAAVRVLVLPLPALALGVTPAPVVIAGILFYLPTFRSSNRGRIGVRVGGNVFTTREGQLSSEELGRLSTATAGKIRVDNE